MDHQPTIEGENKRKRCHGNRRLQQFKRRCRRRGLNEQGIVDAIKNYQHTKVQMVIENTKTIPSLNKRKRLPTSISLRSLSSGPTLKRIKQTNSIEITTTKTNYCRPMYLRKAPNLLIQSLRLQLKLDLKKEHDIKYIYNRLVLFDRQYRIEVHRSKWQTYLRLGIDEQLWPNYIFKMAKINAHEHVQPWIQQRLIDLEQQHQECVNELNIQLSKCPTHFKPIDIIDQRLKEFVQIQQNSFTKKINDRLNRYENLIEENRSFLILSTCEFSQAHMNRIQRMVELQDKLMKIYENFLRFDIRISMGYLPKNFNEHDHSIQSTTNILVFNKKIKRELKQQQFKLLQECKRNWLYIYQHAYEQQWQQADGELKQELKQFELELINHQHSWNCFFHYINYRQQRRQQEILHELIPHYDRKLKFKNKQNKQMNIFPSIIIDVTHHPFTRCELNFLSRGPNYIRPNQSIVRPSNQRRKQAEKEAQEIIDRITRYLSNHKDRSKQVPMNALIHKRYGERLENYMLDRFLRPLPLAQQIRANDELKLVKSIRRKLIQYNLILRQTDKSGVLHIGHFKDYQRKVKQYHEETGAYEEIPLNPLDDVFFKVVQLLNRLRSLKKIHEWQKFKMMPIKTKTELAYMYFLPKPHKKETPLRPIMNTMHTATRPISQFLDRCIRPLFDRYIRSTTIVDGIDLLNKLEVYQTNGCLKSSTLFVTFDVSNLYTMLPQEESLTILGEFLREHDCEKVNGIDISTIIELARLVLQENVFVYDKKFYRQIQGGAMGSPFTLTLANIFMWKWEKQCILSKLPSTEIYGRYIDDIFFTSNQSDINVKRWLDSVNQIHPNIKITYQIGQCLPFLDILLTNSNGSIVSSVYHKPASEPTYLSFISDHPRHVFRNVIQTALMRAIRYSSTFETFNDERRLIRMNLLCNRYPSNYIYQEFHRFFMKYNISCSPLIPLIETKEEFIQLRQQLRTQLTVKQSIVNKSSANVDAPLPDQNVPYTRTLTSTKDRNIGLVETKYDQNLFVHYTHESRFYGLQRDLHVIHNSFYKDTPSGDIRLIVGHRNNPNLEYELSRKRPSSWILKNQSHPNSVSTKAIGIDTRSTTI